MGREQWLSTDGWVKEWVVEGGGAGGRTDGIPVPAGDMVDLSRGHLNGRDTLETRGPDKRRDWAIRKVKSLPLGEDQRCGVRDTHWRAGAGGIAVRVRWS